MSDEVKIETPVEPGDAVGTVVHEGSKELPMAMTLVELKSAGWVYIYDTKTGDRSLANKNMLPTQLKKLRPDGTPVFTLTNPGIALKGGFLKCFLHPDYPDRAHFDELGLPTCRKHNITNDFQRTQHMKKKHKVEWEVIQGEKREKDEKSAVGTLQRLLSLKTDKK